MMAWRDSRFRVSFLPGSSPRPDTASGLRQTTERGPVARGDASWSSSDQMESARLPSHVRCWPIIEDRPRTFSFRRWTVDGKRHPI